MKKISESLENYLELIYDITESGKSETSVTELSRRREVSKPSVNNAMNLLKDCGMIFREAYGKISLTEEGIQHAAFMKNRHIGIRDFLVAALGTDTALADMEACRIEHVVTEDTLNRMMKWGKS